MDGNIFERPLVVLLLLLAESAAFGQWSQSNGPLGGRISAVTSNAVGLFVGTDDGSVYQLTDVGGCWKAFNTGLIKSRVRSFASDVFYIYAGTDLGVFRSPIGIDAWTNITPAGADTAVTSLAISGDTVFAGIALRGLYRSANEGDTWVRADSGLPGSRRYEILASGGYLFAAVEGGLFVSTDAGGSWTALTNLEIQPVVLTQMDSTIFAAAGSLVFRSTDRGTSWSEADSGLSVTGISDLLVFGADVYVSSDSGVYYSTDKGQFWRKIWFGLSSLRVRGLDSFSGDLYAGTERGMSIFDAEGRIWTDVNCGLKATSVRALAVKDSILFAGTIGGGLFVSRNDGADWEPASSGLTSSSVISIYRSGETVFAGTFDAGAFLSTDCGATWSQASNGLPPRSRVFAFTGGGDAVYLGTWGGVFLSSDTGRSWQPINPIGIDTVSALLTTLEYLFAGPSNGGVYRLGSDGWKTFSNGLSDYTIRSFAVKGNYLFAGSLRDDVFRSPIDTAQWERVSSGLPDTSANDLVRWGTYLFTATPFGVFLLADTGETWVDWNDGLTQTSVSALVQDGQTLYAGTVGGGIWIRTLPPTTPQLVSPVDNATNQPIPVTLTWGTSERASGYDLQISPNSSFSVLAICDSVITGTSYLTDKLAHNTKYYWRVRARGLGGPGLFSMRRSFETSPTKTFTNEIVESFPSKDARPDDYRLVSFPGTNAFTVSQLFQGTMGSDWRIFRDNGGVPPNHLTELSAESTLVSGEGFWCLTRDNLTFSQTVPMPALDLVGSYTVNIDAGWNILGNPFERALDRDALRLANVDDSLVFHSYAGGMNFIDTVTLLQPFKGYYFYNYSGLDSLRIPYPFPCQLVPSVSLEKVDWEIKLVLETPAGTDSGNSLGVSSTSTVGRDLLDKPKPPLFFDAPRLYFVRPEWDKRYGLFKSDFRPPFHEGAVWPFEVHDANRSPGTLRIIDENDVPQNFQIFLVNIGDSTMADFRSVGEYSYVPTSEKSSFKLLIGTKDFIEDQVSGQLPMEFQLSQNFPNPFNPSTAIRYAVPREAIVTIEIWSALGQRITILSNEQHSPGIYVREWRGRNAQGMEVSSGVYFYRMLIDGSPFRSTKMLLIR